jgi:hypothetical protein
MTYINTDPDRETMIEYINTLPCLDREGLQDDIEIAIYAFTISHYSGQFSNLYKALCMSRFDPRGTEIDSIWLHDNAPQAFEIYQELIEKFTKPIS